MTKRIVFRNMDKSDVMEEYANEQLRKIEDFLKDEPTPITIDLFLEPSTVNEHHRVELIVKTPNYRKSIDYEYPGTAFYDVLDRVIDTMYKELHEEKRKHHDKLKMTGRHEEFKKQR